MHLPFSQRKSDWHEPPKLEIPGVPESTKAWVAFAVIALALVALVAAFIYSSSPSTVPFPP